MGRGKRAADRDDDSEIARKHLRGAQAQLVFGSQPDRQLGPFWITRAAQYAISVAQEPCPSLGAWHAERQTRSDEISLAVCHRCAPTSGGDEGDEDTQDTASSSSGGGSTSSTSNCSSDSTLAPANQQPAQQQQQQQQQQQRRQERRQEQQADDDSITSGQPGVKASAGFSFAACCPCGSAGVGGAESVEASLEQWELVGTLLQLAQG